MRGTLCSQFKKLSTGYGYNRGLGGLVVASVGIGFPRNIGISGPFEPVYWIVDVHKIACYLVVCRSVDSYRARA